MSTASERDAASASGARPRRPWLAAAAAFNALAAWGGAVALLSGGTDFGEPINSRLPFDSLVLAGLALGLVVGLPLTVLAWWAWTGRPRTNEFALFAGVVLVGWIVVQVAVIRSFSFFQPAYVAIGVGFIAASRRVTLGPRRRGLIAIGVGSIVTSVGVGLMPHLVKNGLTAGSVLSVVLLLAGLGLVGVGARWVLRGRRRIVAAAGAGAVLLVIAVAVSIVAPAVAATSVPSTVISATPTSVGLEFETVTFTTTDGVQLAGWFVPGTNGAGVVVAHGAGSTRSNVLDEAAVLARNGYSVLLADARGHGDSDGTAMDFGWYGDLDIAAATEFLASRPEVDPGRIGVVGLSMGGEEAIGAAATDPRIRAVVAEGATARQAADKAWLSDEYGWRGWLQEQVEKIQYGITDYLSAASPPTSLRDAVARSGDTQFLLITAGTVGDEGHAAAFIESAASDRVTVWTVDGAGHIGGFDTQASEWEQRVVGFLDEHLA